jgi:photosystem II stability/assembly factor-like uncharacterized protein
MCNFHLYPMNCFMKSLFVSFSFLLFSNMLNAQVLRVLTEGKQTSIRGLSVPRKNIVWASGSNGMVARSVDGGITFSWLLVKGYEQRDFRDVEAFDANTAIIISVAEPALILKTMDGGKSWKEVFRDERSGMFLDAMDFKGKQGVVVGDPIEGTVFMAKTHNRGERWIRVAAGDSCSIMEKGEAFFAASGENILLKKNNAALYVSGGVRSRIHYKGVCLPLPVQAGRSTTGANALALHPSGKNGIVVGGDFSDDRRSDSTVVLFSLDPVLSVSLPATFPNGYKSGAAYLTKEIVVAVGTSGVDISRDGGQHWSQLSQQGFHVVKAVNAGSAILAGSKGRIALLELNGKPLTTSRVQ